jgi:hypothetical protein
LCDRVLVFARGGIVAELKGAEITKDHIAACCYVSVPIPTFASQFSGTDLRMLESKDHAKFYESRGA